MGCHLHEPVACRGAHGCWSQPHRWTIWTWVYVHVEVHTHNMHTHTQKGHVLRVVFSCRRCNRKRSWASSRVFAGNYLANQKLVQCTHFFYSHYATCLPFRLVHSFTCAGMLPVQYTKFTEFAGLGVLSAPFIMRGTYVW